MFDATSPALYGIATLAWVILLFLSGLETDLKMFLKYSFVGSMVGLGGVVVSFLLGDLCAVWLLPHFMEDKAFAIWISMPISDVICQLATIPPLLLHARFLSKVRTRRGVFGRIRTQKEN